MERYIYVWGVNELCGCIPVPAKSSISQADFCQTVSSKLVVVLTHGSGCKVLMVPVMLNP